MGIIKLITLVVTSIFLLNSCSTIKIQQKCPKLKAYRYTVKATEHYKISKGYALVPIADLKKGIRGCAKHNRINKLLNKEITEYNKKFTGGKTR